jgi:hypothetical protein
LLWFTRYVNPSFVWLYYYVHVFLVNIQVETNFDEYSFQSLLGNAWTNNQVENIWPLFISAPSPSPPCFIFFVYQCDLQVS